jgi:hypothetical protein
MWAMAVLGTTQMALRLSESVIGAGVLKQLIERAIEQKPSSIDVLELPGGHCVKHKLQFLQ